MSICDTAGQEQYNAITTAHYKKAMGALIVYSVDDRKSFERMPIWIEQAVDNSDPLVSIIIVANKTDVKDSERKVSLEEG